MLIKTTYFLAIIMIVGYVLLGHTTPTRADNLIYYQNGQAEQLPLDKMPKVLTNTDALISKIDDAFQLIVTDELITELKSKKCLEIALSAKREVKPNDFVASGFSYSRLLLPLCNGENCGKGVALYFGNDRTYFTPPYVNKNAAAYLEEIRKIIDK